MSYLELFLLAVGLCFDTFAVSLSGGISNAGGFTGKQIAKILFFFSVFQSFFILAGCLLGLEVTGYVERFAHWVAFLILSYLGLRMIFHAVAFRREEDCCRVEIPIHDTRRLSLLAVATSIDALAVGISIALFRMTPLKIGVTVFLVFLVTALASYVGLMGGKRLGCRIGHESEVVGGFILILIGIKILIEHLF